MSLTGFQKLSELYRAFKDFHQWLHSMRASTLGSESTTHLKQHQSLISSKFLELIDSKIF